MSRLNTPLVRLLAAGSLVALTACGDQKAPPAAQRVDTTPAPKISPETQLDPAGAGEANGFGKNVAWRKFDVAMDEAKASGKPIMMVVHTSWCGRCKALKPSFKQPGVAELSKEFVMVNVDQDRVPAAASYAPDGGYIPRVMFFSPDGELDAELTNGRGGKYDYFYTPMDDLSVSMRTALERHGRKG